MNVIHIPQCSIHNRNVHISILNGPLRDMEQVHSGICEIDLMDYWLVIIMASSERHGVSKHRLGNQQINNRNARSTIYTSTATTHIHTHTQEAPDTKIQLTFITVELGPLDADEAKQEQSSLL